MTRTTLNERKISVASYPTYDGARDALKFLKNHEFPTQYADIIAEKVEEIKSRPVAWLATLQMLRGVIMGALTGVALALVADFFDFASFTFSLTTMLLYSAAIGAGIGLVLELLYSLVFGVGRPRNPRYFASVFDVTVHEQYYERAARLLNMNDADIGPASDNRAIEQHEAPVNLHQRSRAEA